jgi:radical SAM superfamily enzyme YgiQ (UPF0313 family)
MRRKKKLLLINPYNPIIKSEVVDTSSIYPPLALGIVAGLTPPHWEVEILDENFDNFKYREADLVGFTAFTANVNRVYELAAIYRKEGIKTVLGGIHASMLPEEAMKYVSTVVTGEAESSWSQVIIDFEKGNLKPLYKGTLVPLKNMPVPRRDLFHPGYKFSSIYTSRGCPMRCDFCSVHIFGGGRFRQRPVEEVLNELETIPHERIFFIDDNIVGYSNQSVKRAEELFKGMIRRGIKKDWYCQASLNIADHPDVLKYAADAGCQMVFIGIESEKSDQLNEANKKMNLKIGTDNYESKFEKIHQAGMSILGALIFGLDSDTPQDIEDRAQFAIRSSLDTIQASILTPIPGTSLFNRMVRENRMINNNYPKDWELYHGFDIVFQPKTMSAEHFKALMIDAWDKIWDEKLLHKKMLKTLKDTKNPKAAAYAYWGNISRQNLTYGWRKANMAWTEILKGLYKTS